MLIARSIFVRSLSVWAPVAFLGLGAGCGPSTHTITGEVAYADGTPLPGGRIEVESEHADLTKRVNATANIDEFGGFKLTAAEGKYRAILLPPPPASVTDERSRPNVPLPTKYRAYDQSGLEVEVSRTTSQTGVKLVIQK